MASYNFQQKSLLIKQHAKPMSLVDKRAIINRKPKLSKPQHTLKCTEGTKHFQLLLKYSFIFVELCIKTLNENQIICFSWGH